MDTSMTIVHALSVVLLVTSISTGDSRALYSKGPAEEPNINLNLTDSLFSWMKNESSEVSYSPIYSTLDNAEQGFVNLGALQSFTSTLTSQEKEDVLDSILLAQLTASHMYSRETEYTDWYRIYVSALKKLGWVIDSYRFFNYTPPSDSINLSQATLSLIRLLCTKATQIQVSQDLLAAYSKLAPSDLRVSMFTNYTTKTNGDMKATFQVLPATTVFEGATSIVFSNFHFTSSTPKYRYLSYLWRVAQVKLSAALSVGSLHHDEYAVYREAVRRHLHGAAKEFVKEIPLA